MRILSLALLTTIAFSFPALAQDSQTMNTDLANPNFSGLAVGGGGGGTDNLGDHTATQALIMSNFDITGANDVYAMRYFHLSDESAKTDIVTLTPGMIDQLRPVSYNLIATGDYQVGFVAQEVAAAFPHMVMEQDGMMMVDYTQVIAPLVAEVQDLRARVAALEAAAE